MKIYETENFILESHDSPHVSREDWGHIKISPKFEIKDRTGKMENGTFVKDK